MWHKVYYRETNREYHGIGKQILPYSVKCKDLDEFKSLINRLRRRGYKCVDQIEGQYAVLINTELKRWCTYPKPVKMPCIDDRTLTAEEIMKLIDV